MPPVPVLEFCRGAGFWGTHAFANPEQECSQNITQQVIDEAGGTLSICGQQICNTELDDSSSALEALCVNAKSQRHQLARQLVAAALNCVVSGGDANCTGISIDAEFDECNTLCADPNATKDALSACIFAIDCFNNGGHPENGTCLNGVCAVGGAFCGPGFPCASGECVPDPTSCKQQPIPEVFIDEGCPGKQGPAGGERCGEAIKTTCTVIPPDDALCATEVICQ